MSKVVNYPECAFCNASMPDVPANERVYLQPAVITSSSGKVCCIWRCPNECVDENGNFNRQPKDRSFLKDREINILVEQGVLGQEALAARYVGASAPTSAPPTSSALGKRASPWKGPDSNVDVAQPDLKIADPLKNGLLAFVNQTDSIDALLAISDMVNKRIGALANKQ